MWCGFSIVRVYSCGGLYIGSVYPCGVDFLLSWFTHVVWIFYYHGLPMWCGFSIAMINPCGGLSIG